MKHTKFHSPGAGFAALVAIMLSACSSVSLANELELGISDEFIELKLTQEYDDDFSGSFGLLHADSDDIDSKQLSYRFYTQDEVDEYDLQLGAQVFWLDVESEDGFGVSLGLAAGRQLAGKLGVVGSIYYAPDILTSGDFENGLELDLKLNYQLLENGAIFVGFRKIEADPGGGDYDIYDDPYIGIRFAL